MVQYFPIVTGSLTVTGSVNVSGSITTNSTITATTLVVQTITSSISSITGSTNFGSLSSNTHIFTGSMAISGGLVVSTPTPELTVGTTGVTLGNALTDSHVISGSLRVNPNGLFVTSSGQVGIGTTTPNDLLEVRGGFIRLSATSGNGPQFNLYSNGQTSNHVTLAQGFALATDNIGYLYNRANADFVFGTNNTERLRITSGGSILIYGSNSSSSPFSLGTSTAKFQLMNGGVYGLAGDVLTNGSTYLQSQRTDGNTTAYNLYLQPLGGQTLIYNTTSLYTNVRLSVKQTTGDATAEIWSSWAGDQSTTALYIVKFDNVNTTSQVFQRFVIGNGSFTSGQINANGANQAAFGSWSDIRLKENVENLPSQLDNIMALRPVEFDYKDGSGHQTGFIAQEMQDIYSDAVGEDSEGFLTITGWSKTEARLVKAIQELNIKFEEYKATHP